MKKNSPETTYSLEQLELTLEDARRQLGYTEVKAPIGGTITAPLGQSR